MKKAVWLFMYLFFSVPISAFPQEERRVEPVIVTATRIEQPLSQVSESATLITEEEITRSRVGSVADLLRRVPGVDVQRSGSPGKLTSIRLRGAESDQTLVTLDGVQINNPFDQLVNFADLTSDNIERVEVIRGGESALYGSEAVGGVISLFTKKGEGPPRFSALFEGGGLDSTRGHLSLSGSQKGWVPVHYSFSLSRQGNNGQTRRDDYRNSSFSSRFGTDLGRWGTLDFVARLSDSDTQVPFDFIFDPFTVLPGFPFGITRQVSDRNFDLRETFLLGTGIYRVKPTAWWDIRVQLSGHSTDRDSDNPFDPILAPNFLKQRTDTTKFTGEVQNDFTVGEIATLTLGYEYEQDRARFTSLDNFASNFGFGLAMPTFSSTRASVIDRGLYFQAHLELWERAFITGGVRYDRLSTFGATTNFKAAGAFLIKETGTKVKANWGTQFNAPTIVDLFFPVFGNPALGPERSESYEAGLEQELFKGRLKLELTFFNLEFKDRIEFVPDPASVTPPFGALRNVGRGQSRGFEFGASGEPFGGLTLFFNWTSLDTENRGRPRVEFVRRPRNKFNFRASYRPRERVKLDLEVVRVASQRDPFLFIEAGGRLRTKDRIPGYTRGDLTAAYDLITEKDKSPIVKLLSIYARAENFLDRKYQEVKGFDAPGFLFVAGVKGVF